MASVVFGNKLPKNGALVRRGKRGLAGEIADLRQDTDEAFEDLEDTLKFQGVFTDATRPAANTFVAGDWIFNPSDNAPNFSNGTDWYDAMGNLT